MESSAKIRVLIVDDEPIARQTLKEYCALESDVEMVGECRYGAEAVKRIAALRPDLVFLDVQMRRLNGLEVVDKIGRDAMPLVIFVTAYEQYAVEAFELNAVDYLLKPFDRERFRAALDRARRGSRVSSDDVRAQVHAVRGLWPICRRRAGRRPASWRKNDRYILSILTVRGEASRNYITLHGKRAARCGMHRIDADPTVRASTGRSSSARSTSAKWRASSTATTK
jgi:two-component system LytT family response regulator